MLDLITILGVILIAGSNYMFTGWFIKYARLRKITDVPTARSSHSRPTPRGGGIGFVITSITAFILYFGLMGLLNSGIYLAMLATLSAIACLGWFDDRRDLSQTIRFTVQVLAAASIIFFIEGLDTFFIPYMSHISLGFFSPFFGLLWITGVTNIYNFMDGVDGIASVQALSTSAGWMIFAKLWNEPVLFTINLIVFVAIAMFLIYNWTPARIFMGDVGSVFLGFFFAIMPFLAAAIAEERTVGFTLWIGALLMWPFLFDSTFTLLRRILKGENVFHAHRTHLYQRLNIAGWSHSVISLLYLTFSFLCIIVAMVFTHENDFVRVVLLFGLLALSFLYVLGVQRVEKKL